MHIDQCMYGLEADDGLAWSRCGNPWRLWQTANAYCRSCKPVVTNSHPHLANQYNKLFQSRMSTKTNNVCLICWQSRQHLAWPLILFCSLPLIDRRSTADWPMMWETLVWIDWPLNVHYEGINCFCTFCQHVLFVPCSPILSMMFPCKPCFVVIPAGLNHWNSNRTKGIRINNKTNWCKPCFMC